MPANRTDAFVLATLGVLFAVLVTATQAHRLARFDVRSFDLAIFAQGLWNAAHLHATSSIQETSFFAVHFSPVLFALAPLARLANDSTPLLLVFVQGLALGAQAPLAYLLALRAGRAPAFWLGAVTLAQPATLALALDGFHDVTLGVPLGLLLCLAIERERHVLAAAVALALLADEVYPLVLPGAALWLLSAGRKREAARVLAVGVVAFLLVNELLLGWLRGGALHVESLYGHWKSPALLAHFVPRAAFETFVLVLWLLGPLGYLPLLDGSRLAPCALVLAASFASARPAQRSIDEHYHAPLLPFVVAAAAAGLARLEALWPRRGARLGVALLVAGTLTATLVRRDEVAGAARDLRSRAADPRLALVEQVPPDGRVLASVDFLAALSAREHLYGLPGALRGTKDWSSVPYELPDLDAVLVDTNDTASFAPGLDLARDERWESIVLDRGLGVRGIVGSTVLLAKVGEPLVAAIASTSVGEALTEAPDAPRLVAIERDAIVWAPPPSGRLNPRWLETSDGTVRPVLWRLYRARPWPPGCLLRERASLPPGPVRLLIH
ncbi:MAG TPA: DUF2079 domain-containing protein [Planctomycetota bacterium]|nr:DUF2079 domain-containing protein [Planctomycetota bacterium]